jgi:hypothetical protein
MALVTSGEELSSSREAEDRLRRWQRKRKWRNTGTLPEAERDLEEKRNALARLEEGTRRLAALRRDREALETRREELELELRRHQRDALLERRRRWTEAEREARDLGSLAEELETKRAVRTAETADGLRAAVLRLREAEKDRAAMAETLEAAKSERETLPKPEDAPRLPGRGLGLALILLGVLLCAFGLFTLFTPILPIPVWGSGILTACILLLIPGILRLRGVHQREAEERSARQLDLERTEARIGELERQLQADEAETAECTSALEEVKAAALCGEADPLDAADALDELIRELEKAKNGAASAARLAETLGEDLEEPEDLEGETTMPRGEAERRLNETEHTLRETERALAREEAVFALHGDPLVLSS